ncbi:MAG: Fic family protein [Clostridia bacterium]|nr:Fic family protein [Clostridia bacterium]
MENYPPYNITDRMLDYVAKIMKKVGEIDYIKLNKKPELRKQNRINSIHSSLAIENNALSLNQVKDVIDGKPVIGEQKDIQEVKNAYKAYEELENINPYSIEDLKKIHGIMTFLVVEESGKFRNHGECVRDGDNIIFVCPPAKMVDILMDQLFNWLNEAKDRVHPLILSSVFHYEFLFIHPFADGNGRMSRLWQTAILSKWEEIFEYIPIESLIKRYQEDYYNAIYNCNNAGNSNEFIEFMLKMIDETMCDLLESTTQEITQETTQEKIISLIRENSNITQTQMAKKIGVTRDGIAYNIKLLKQKGVIERVGSSKNGSWKILEKQ